MKKEVQYGYALDDSTNPQVIVYDSLAFPFIIEDDVGCTTSPYGDSLMLHSINHRKSDIPGTIWDVWDTTSAALLLDTDAHTLTFDLTDHFLSFENDTLKSWLYEGDAIKLVNLPYKNVDSGYEVSVWNYPYAPYIASISESDTSYEFKRGVSRSAQTDRVLHLSNVQIQTPQISLYFHRKK